MRSQKQHAGRRRRVGGAIHRVTNMIRFGLKFHKQCLRWNREIIATQYRCANVNLFISDEERSRSAANPDTCTA